MNTGIQDAFNLGWKLALAVREFAAPGLLDTYEAERHPIARGVLRGTHLGTRLFLARNPVMEAVREFVVPAVVNVPSVRRWFLASVSQLNVAYPDSSLSVDADSGHGGRGFLRRSGGIRAGERVPDAALIDGADGKAIALFDLISRGWTLLLFPGTDSTPERAAELDRLAQQVLDTVGDEVRSYVVLSAPLGQEPETATLLDPTGDIGRALGGDRGLVALVRPDGYLGFRGAVGQPGELVSYLARVFAMQMRGIVAG
jgi:hypothetical protein